MNETLNEAPKAHPFELAGMGHGPYRYVGFYALPSPDLAAANPEAYNARLREMPKLNSGCGTCSNCGMAIMNIHIVRDGKGGLWGVGCDCIEKVGDKSLSDPAKVKQAKHEANLRHARQEARRIAQHEAWLLAICPTGETNAERIVRQNWERDMELAARHEATLARAESFRDITSQLPSNNEFFTSLIGQLSNGRLSDRQAYCICKQIHGYRAEGSVLWNSTMDRLTSNK